ncbi:rab-GTPase-TBC domain-containing protein [Radiomyces spectabilis]|uniref:rab-GTPase-TBC domain-containing protein n=1 Tax=Radiomyces spectabilis TaxID=64574 RepID=UPI00221FBEF3|nr:rab-GTPase-TBC domain-containing protein [Radiomyces spectabilis]KAI8364135.1 rab-GTPase-TBC domain-containing protein [Radiomyces spectabilis]
MASTRPSQKTTSSSDTDFTTFTDTGESLTSTPSQNIVNLADPHATQQPSEDTGDHHPNNAKDIKKQYQIQQNVVPDVAAEMERWYAMTDRYGFLEDEKSELNEKYYLFRQKAKEVERSEKWAHMAIAVNAEGIHGFHWSNKFIQRVYKGIPDCWRRDAWYFLCTDGFQTAKDDKKLLETYAHLLSKSTPHERQIDLDIPRTLHGHIMFRERYGSGQRALFNVLRAFAVYDEEVGYCQGMTNIAAILLMYYEEEVQTL